jgi:restriction system protein
LIPSLNYKRKDNLFKRESQGVRKMKIKAGPKFVQHFDKVLQALKHLGGSGRPTEIIEYISANYGIDKSENELLSDGLPRFNKNINWARFYLAKAGLIDGSTRGVWALTERGMAIDTISRELAMEIFTHVQANVTQSNNETPTEDVIPTNVEVSENLDHRAHLAKVLSLLAPAAFERLCQRLLREAGFEKVEVTGRTGDGGIDGQGILRINPFVSFQVLFQCKRYAGSVGSPTIRDFRGSMMGRADKGIILTTGTFTNDARKESIRDGAPPIELVDGGQLIEMLEELELGLRKKKTITIYEVDEEFFNSI